MNVLAIIPARAGSKGVPNKNARLLGGKPLIAYSIEQAQRSKFIRDIIVSTDSEEIGEIARKFGAIVPFIRPSHLSSDTAKSIDVVIHAVEFLKWQGKNYDGIILLQPTSPFREVSLIDSSIEQFFSGEIDSLVSVKPVPHEYNPHWVYEINEDGFLSLSTGEKEIISRRQDLPEAFHRDGNVYIASIDVILNRRSFYGEKLGFIETKSEINVNIDTMEDWDKAEKLIQVIK
jgi:CMP-N-acetylneuraminic acid synthetase